MRSEKQAVSEDATLTSTSRELSSEQPWEPFQILRGSSGSPEEMKSIVEPSQLRTACPQLLFWETSVPPLRRRTLQIESTSANLYPDEIC